MPGSKREVPDESNGKNRSDNLGSAQETEIHVRLRCRRRLPWWLYLLVVALTILSVLHRRNLFVYLYEGIRWLPRAIKTKRLQRALMRKWQGQIAAWDDAYEQQLMAEVIKQMDPKDVEELRKNGFL